ncbi:MAG: hypothetical protein N2544_14845 [Burkholderiales bacterium]|nr:hypothetical protein [Burkholderiales bacterium]
MKPLRTFLVVAAAAVPSLAWASGGVGVTISFGVPVPGVAWPAPVYYPPPPPVVVAPPPPPRVVFYPPPPAVVYPPAPIFRPLPPAMGYYGPPGKAKGWHRWHGHHARW